MSLMNAISKLNDIWILGNHRLMCGDSTHISTLQQLLEKRRADLVFLDPPYNAHYEPGERKYTKIRNNDLPLHHYQQFLKHTLQACRQFMKPSASLYVCHAHSYQRELQNTLESVGFVIRNQIVWAKHHFLERVLVNSSREGDCVLDSFGGAGSTLIACEQLNRCAYVVEIEPHYCDVIIQRWENATQKRAYHATTGQLFSSIH